MTQNLGIFEKLSDTMQRVATMEIRFWESVIPTGLSGIDQRTGGFRSADLVILASEQPWLHASLTQVFVESVAVKQRLPVVVIRLGHDLRNYCEQAFKAKESVQWAWGTKLGENKEPDWPKLTALTEAPIYITQPLPGADIDYLFQEVEKFAESIGQLGLIVIEGIERLNIWAKATSSITNPGERWASVSANLKQLATYLKCPLVVDVRIDNQRPDDGHLTNPGLSDLPYEGALANCADLVLMLQDFSYLREGTRACLETRFSRTGLVARTELDYLSELGTWVEVE